MGEGFKNIRHIGVDGCDTIRLDFIKDEDLIVIGRPVLLVALSGQTDAPTVGVFHARELLPFLKKLRIFPVAALPDQCDQSASRLEAR